MRFTSLGSGSEGNALLIEAGEGAVKTRILIDCGFGVKELERRLARVGLCGEDLDALFVTHEHSDHIGGAFRVGRRFDIPVHMTRGTFLASRDPLAELAEVRRLESHGSLRFQDLEIRSFPVPHDAREPVQFVIDDGRTRLGVLTDLGHATPLIVQELSGVDALILECNHDADLLSKGRYPWALKRRILGPYGHLANEDSARLIAALDRSRLEWVFAAHLSQENNHSALAQEALAFGTGRPLQEIAIADQQLGFEWTQISAG